MLNFLMRQDIKIHLNALFTSRLKLSRVTIICQAIHYLPYARKGPLLSTKMCLIIYAPMPTNLYVS